MAQQINLDAIAEVRVLLNSYRAEYGRAGGGQVQIVSKGGTSAYHGNVYHYLRNEALNANNFFNNRSNIKKPRYRFNTFGANLGGPVPGLNKDEKKLFFFYSLEAPIVSRPGPVRNWTMPTDREMQGDFSQTLDSQGPPDLHQGSAGEWGVQRGHRWSGVLPGQHHPGEPPQLERQGASEHAAAGEQLRSHVHAGAVQLHDAGKRRKPEDEQRRPRGLEADHRTTASTSRSRTGTRISAAARSPPVRAKWGFFNTHYLNTDRGGSANYAKILSPTMVLESDFGIRQQTEQFYPLTDADWTRINRNTIGFTVGQFHPELNPRNVIPKVHVQRAECAELHVRQPAGRSGRGLADVVPNEPDLDPRQPLAQGGLLLRAVAEL